MENYHTGAAFESTDTGEKISKLEKGKNGKRREENVLQPGRRLWIPHLRGDRNFMVPFPE